MRSELGGGMSVKVGGEMVRSENDAAWREIGLASSWAALSLSLRRLS